MKKTNILKESCPKNVMLMKTKNNTFLTFLDKMQFSEILCLVNYDWFCADGSHIRVHYSLITEIPGHAGRCHLILMNYDPDRGLAHFLQMSYLNE